MNDPAGVAELRIGVLGPLRVWRGEKVVDLGPLQQRVVFAVLALQAGRPVGRQQMISAVWGETAPRNAVNLVQRHVSGLRRLLEPDRPGHAPSGLLVWTDAGYLLTVPAGALDMHVFEAELSRARAGQAAAADHELLAAERDAVLRDACTRLSPDCQRLLAMLTSDPPVPYTEISARLGISVGSIGPIRGRCLERLRRDPAVAALIDAETASQAR